VSVVSLARQGVFGAARTLGVMEYLRTSEWRRKRLLILCYHGVSLRDEHEWKPTLYMRQETLRARLAQLRSGGYHVVSLDEGLVRLREGSLPPGAVALTFDDGTFDFFDKAAPVLREFGYPATVYQTTFYSDLGEPVFDVFVSYLLWQARDRVVDLSALDDSTTLADLGDAAVRAAVADAIVAREAREQWNSAQRRDLLERLASMLGLDLAPLLAQRILSLMTAEEIATLAAEGFDFQLHTHRHCLFEDRSEFSADLQVNRDRLTAATGRIAHHFCYPSGVYRRDAVEWLASADVTSATTCDPGIADATSSTMLLPRLVVNDVLPALTFEAWTSGLAALLPRRTRLAHPELSPL